MRKREDRNAIAQAHTVRRHTNAHKLHLAGARWQLTNVSTHTHMNTKWNEGACHYQQTREGLQGLSHMGFTKGTSAPAGDCSIELLQQWQLSCITRVVGHAAEHAPSEACTKSDWQLSALPLHARRHQSCQRSRGHVWPTASCALQFCALQRPCAAWFPCRCSIMLLKGRVPGTA